MTSLLEHARRLLDHSSAGTVSAWPRAAALLARQELEGAINAFWAARAPGVRWVSMRVQLDCLREYLGDRRLAADVAWTWHALSRATHHHPYELDPTREELASLIAGTERVTALLRQASGGVS